MQHNFGNELARQLAGNGTHSSARAGMGGGVEVVHEDLHCRLLLKSGVNGDLYCAHQGNCSDQMGKLMSGGPLGGSILERG
jgi:hypothetical protein